MGDIYLLLINNIFSYTRKKNISVRVTEYSVTWESDEKFGC